MKIVHYPHPALRFKSADVTRIDSSLRRTVERMFELMYDADGIGLAANQVGLPLRLFVVNLAARDAEKDEEFVFINPQIRTRRGSQVGEEGCLSLPGLYSDVRRASELSVSAFDLNGQPFEMRLSDLPARVIQHETDHLDGVMFTDRLVDETDAKVRAKVAEFEYKFRSAQKDGTEPTNEAIQKQLTEIARSGAVPAHFAESGLMAEGKLA